MIEAKHLRGLLEETARLKFAGFDLAKFNHLATNKSNELTALEYQITREVGDLIEAFDLKGDRLISPEEFFNIIVYAYS